MVPAMTTPRDIVPLAASCVWGGFAAPDIQHCEQNLCGWIAAPADTWSNLAYFAAAWWVWRRAAGDALQRWFGWSIAVVGATSFVFHATFTAAGQFLDYFGMFVYLMLPLSINVKRLGGRRWKAFYWTGVAGCAGAVPLFWRLGLGVQYTVAAVAALLLGSEWLLSRRPVKPRYRPLFISAAGTAAAFGVWQLDFHRVLCDPSNHLLQWHALWHVLTAASMPPLVRFYREASALEPASVEEGNFSAA